MAKWQIGIVMKWKMTLELNAVSDRGEVKWGNKNNEMVTAI